MPADSLHTKKVLIEALTRRLFKHTEHGINIPGRRLDEARAAYERESDPDRRRVKGAMLAGALFSRATDVFTKLVEMQALGVDIQPENALMRECGRCLQEALELGKRVLHRSGQEGIDELWGEPFRVFSIPVEDYFESRYVKIALTMRDIDRLGNTLIDAFDRHPLFWGVGPRIQAYADAARTKTETLRTDPDIFEVWASFVVAGEQLLAHKSPGPAEHPQHLSVMERYEFAEGQRLLHAGKELISDIARARTPMPKSAREFIERCHVFSQHSVFKPVEQTPSYDAAFSARPVMPSGPFGIHAAGA